MFKILAALLLTLSSTPLTSVEQLPETQEAMAEGDELSAMLSAMTDEERKVYEIFSGFDWKVEGEHKLPHSHSTICLPSEYTLLLGDEAVKAISIFGNPASESMEAAVFDDSCENQIIFEHIKEGYVSLTDWHKLNSKDLLNTIRKCNVDENKERRKNGLGEMQIIGWIREPTLDRNAHTVGWTYEGKIDGEGTFIMSIALKLGREGFERIYWVTNKDNYVLFGGHLDVILKAFSFDPGYKYTDFKLGDKTARYRIATLIPAIAS